MQDIASPSTAKASGSALGSAPGARPPELARTLVLGANSWLIGVLWPLLARAETSALELTLALLSPLPLLLAAWLPAERARARLRPFLLLCAHPAALGAAMVARPEGVNQQMYGPLALGLLWLSLCAYGASAATACASRGPSLRAAHVPLGKEPWDSAPAERPCSPRAFVGLCCAGAAALCLLAPAMGGLPALEQAWGEAALDGGVLTAVVGAALAVATVGVYMADGLRSATSSEPRTDGGVRVASLLFLALLGAATYLITQP